MRHRILRTIQWAISLQAVASVFGDELIFRGNLHTSLGNATLSVNSSDVLVIDNIGPTGSDGVRIALGQADSFDAFLLPQPSGVPVGARERFESWGTVAGNPMIKFSSFGFTKTTANLTIDATFPGLGASPRLIEAYFNSIPVGTFTVTSTLPQIATAPSTAWPRVIGVRRNQAPQNRPAVVCRWSSPTAITLIGGPSFTCNEIRVIALTPSNTLDLVAQTDGTGSDVPEIFLDDEDTQPVCLCDLNGDDSVGIADLTLFLSNFGMANMTASDGDFNADGVIDIADLTVMLANFGTTC